MHQHVLGATWLENILAEQAQDTGGHQTEHEEAIGGAFFKNESILKISSVFYPVPKVPVVLSSLLFPPVTEELVTNTHTFRYVRIYL